jgi:hypothetical protein
MDERFHVTFFQNITRTGMQVSLDLFLLPAVCRKSCNDKYKVGEDTYKVLLASVKLLHVRTCKQ